MDQTTSSTATATATIDAPAATTSTWAIDPSHSEVGFAVKHMMVSSTKGRFAEFDGTIALDEADVTRSRVDVEIAVASINTRDEKRDAHLRSADFFDADTFPTISFRSTRVEPAGPDRLRVNGDLTIRGVTRPVVLDVEVNGRGSTPWGGEVIGYEASTRISRKDFGLTWNVALETGGVLVGDEVKISLDVEAGRQA
jgi:polyisoprenoid-binding protein YceI